MTSTLTPKAPTKAPDYRIRGHATLAAFTVAALVIGCGGWAATAELSGAIIAHGSVVIERHVKKIQHRDGGIVAEINVKNGDHVEAGAILIRLDETIPRAELAIIQSQLVELRCRVARLTAERDEFHSITFPPQILSMAETAQVRAGEIRLFEANREGRVKQKDQLTLRIGQLNEETTGIIAQRDAKLKELTLFRSELAEVRQLYAQHLTQLSRVYALEREEARIGGDYGNFVAQTARVAGQISEIKLQIVNIDVAMRTDAQKELREHESRIAELVEREIAAKDRLTRAVIRAPLSGFVHELEVYTIGGIVTPAEPVMLIVPEGDALSIELKVAPNDIDQIRIDQDVRLRFTSFNRRTTPEVEGRISFVSADISQEPGSKQSYFTVRARPIKSGDWVIDGKPIVPGMPVEAFITTGERTALSFLIKPVSDQFARAFRER